MSAWSGARSAGGSPCLDIQTLTTSSRSATSRSRRRRTAARSAFWSARQLAQLKAAFKAAGKKLDMGGLRSFPVAGRFATRSDWQADLGDFEREVDRDVRTIALADQGGAGAEGEARRPIGEQGGRQARRQKASAVNFPRVPHFSRLSRSGAFPECRSLRGFRRLGRQLTSLLLR